MHSSCRKNDFYDTGIDISNLYNILLLRKKGGFLKSELGLGLWIPISK